MRAACSSSAPSQPKPGNVNPRALIDQKATPFKERYATSRSEQAVSLLRKSIAKTSAISSLLDTSMASVLASVSSKSMSASTSIKSCWNKSWSKYKFSSPIGARQTHYEAIRNEIMQKYGALASSLLGILSAAVTDAVFWWLAEMLLDDGM